MSKLALAEECLARCKENHVHHQAAAKFLEPKLLHEEEEVVEAVELFVRYNLYDRRLTDKDIDYAKSFLKEYDEKQNTKGSRHD